MFVSGERVTGSGSGVDQPDESDESVDAPEETSGLAPEETSGLAPEETSGLADWVLIVLGIAIVAVWVLVVRVAGSVDVSPQLRSLALFVHFVALVAGLGAVLTVDWMSLLWLFGRRPLDEVLRVASGVHGLIWISLVVLVGTGLALQPDMSSPWTWVKLTLVLVVALNGLRVHSLSRQLWRADDVVPPDLMGRVLVAATVSQIAWWGATLVGYVTSHS